MNKKTTKKSTSQKRIFKKENSTEKVVKKKVIAYLHTHWDSEWYREFEVFRLRLVRVFDNVLYLLSRKKIPAFYFDGQVSALLDYLEIRPEKERLVKKYIKEKRLFIGPFYAPIDEFLTDRYCFEKNLELGLKISKKFGCTDFIGYLADTFGHSRNVPKILQKYGIDKCIVWRGCGNLPSEFDFKGVNAVNLIQGYFMDIFSSHIPLVDKAKLLKNKLDKIAKKSSDVLLLPIGADHLGVEPDILEQIDIINDILEDYEIKLSTPFEYFELVKNRFKRRVGGELRDNSNSFILPGTYSARTKIKRYNAIASYKLHFADVMQQKLAENYSSAIEYGYKLLLRNQAHDAICGCSTDEVHNENITRYKKVIQLADTILKELKFKHNYEYNNTLRLYNRKYHSVMEFEDDSVPKKCQLLSKKKAFADEILYDTQLIPITEDYQNIYTYLKEIKKSKDELSVFGKSIKNSHVELKIVNNRLLEITDGKKSYHIDFVDYKDEGDTYNFAPGKRDKLNIAKILETNVIMDGNLRVGIRIRTAYLIMYVYLDKDSKLVKFYVNWYNQFRNKIWQVRIHCDDKLKAVYSEDMNALIRRKFNPDYDIRKHLPTRKGIEAKTNTAPMQRYVGTEDLGIITKGLTEYMVFKNTLSVTLLRSVGVISNPKNTARTTPAGPPIEVPEAQQIGYNTCEFAIGFFGPNKFKNHIEEFYCSEINV